jgi:hypothetical protein
MNDVFRYLIYHKTAGVLSSSRGQVAAVITYLLSKVLRVRQCVGLLRLFCLHLAPLLVVVSIARGQQTTNSEKDLVEFFKSAITSPPDIEHFTAIQRTLRERELPPEVRLPIPNPTNTPPQFFEGARSGKNYFLREISATNAFMSGAGSRLVVGRKGSKTYHFNLNTMTYTYDASDSLSPNPLVASGEGFYATVSQFLNMGLADIQAGSVSWNGNEFSAVRDGGFRVYGHLELSNGLPSTLSFSANRGGTSFKACTYLYPDPPSALSGFPSRIVVSVLFEDGLHPFIELRLLEITLAKQELSEGFFSDTKFVTTNIVYTNVFSNGVLMAILPGGKMVKAPTAHAQVETGYPHRARKAIVIICACGTTIGFLLISLRFRKTK